MDTHYFEFLDQRSFDYGNQIVVLTVHIEHLEPAYIFNHPIYTHSKDSAYYRVVSAYSFRNEDEIPDNFELIARQQKGLVDEDIPKISPSVKKKTFCRIRDKPVTQSNGMMKYSPSYFFKRLLGEQKPHVTYYPEGPHIDLVDQLEVTLYPVLNQLDTQKQLSESSVDIAVDVTLDETEEVTSQEPDQVIETIADDVSDNQYESL